MPSRSRLLLARGSPKGAWYFENCSRQQGMQEPASAHQACSRACRLLHGRRGPSFPRIPWAPKSVLDTSYNYFMLYF